MHAHAGAQVQHASICTTRLGKLLQRALSSLDVAPHSIELRPAVVQVVAESKELRISLVQGLRQGVAAAAAAAEFRCGSTDQGGRAQRPRESTGTQRRNTSSAA